MIYPSHSVEQEQLVIISEFLTSGRITRIYLDELSAVEPLPIGLELMLLTIQPDNQAVITAKTLISRSQQLPDCRAIIEMISTIMVYRFTNLTRTELEAMIGITLQQTRVYQDAKAEGKAEGVNEGRQAEGQSLILRQLSRRFGTLSFGGQYSRYLLAFGEIRRSWGSIARLQGSCRFNQLVADSLINQ